MTDSRFKRWREALRREAKHFLGPFICALAIVTFLCSGFGFWLQYRAAREAGQGTGNVDWTFPVFKSIQIFLLNAGAEEGPEYPNNIFLTMARITAPLLVVLVSWAVIWRVVEDLLRFPRLMTQSDHTVICGLGQIGQQLLEDLQQRNRARLVVVIENNPAHPVLRIASSYGAAVVIGDSTSAETLREARAAHAAEVFVVNGDDGVNLEVVAELARLAKPRKDGKRLRVYVHIADTGLASTLQPYSSVLHGGETLEIRVFNVPKAAAAQLVTHQLWPHAPLRESEVAHYVLIGFGAMGQVLAVQLAQLGHFPNRRRSRFTIADGDIESSARAFLGQFSRFTSWTDETIGVAAFCPEEDDWSWNRNPLPPEIRVPGDEAVQYVCNARFVPLDSGRPDERFVRRLVDEFADEAVRPVVVLCAQQDRANFETAVQLHELLTSLDCREPLPLFVWLPRQPALAATLDRGKGFFSFGACRDAASYDEITKPAREEIGRTIHEDYEWHNPGVVAPWAKLPEKNKESNRIAADHLAIKLATARDFHSTAESPAEAELGVAEGSQEEWILAEMEHNRWMTERLLAGWRYSPSESNPQEAAEHKRRALSPSIVPWLLLPSGEKFKDIQQVRAVLRVSADALPASSERDVLPHCDQRLEAGPEDVGGKPTATSSFSAGAGWPDAVRGRVD